MNTHIITAQAGLKGFDCNTPLGAGSIAQASGAGFRFVVRYVGRQVYHPGDLTAQETEAIFSGGLGLMAVQHVESESSWIPTASKGTDYGRNAATLATVAKVPTGAMLWCDLEGVALGVTPEDVIGYVNNWHSQVAAAGFTPGLYVGWRCGLTPQQLYQRLRFTHYWGAYNLDVDQEPATRGIQMKQQAVPQHMTFSYDGNVTRVDRNGGAPLIAVPDGWGV